MSNAHVVDLKKANARRERLLTLLENKSDYNKKKHQTNQEKRMKQFYETKRSYHNEHNRFGE